MKETCSHVDVLIVGGGLVGSCLALALANQPIKMAIVEANLAAKSHNLDWSLGLSLSSVRIFQTLGIWSSVKAYATSVAQVHVSDAGHFGVTRLRASDYHVNALGYVIAAQQLLSQVQAKVSMQANVEYLCPGKLQHLESTEKGYRVRVQMGDQSRLITSNLLVAADGGDSLVRKLLHIPVTIKNYAQNALIASVEWARHHQYIAYERFTKAGPLAALPLAGNRSGIVWVLDAERSKSLMQLDQVAFCQHLQMAFGYRLGRLLSAQRNALLPLRSLYAQQQVMAGVVLLGNAAHMLHPVAAQGFNLSLKDMAALAQHLIQAIQAHQNLGDVAILQKYLRQRQPEQKLISGFTAGLVSIFSQPMFPVPWLRSMGLCGLDNFPLLKRSLVRQAIG